MNKDKKKKKRERGRPTKKKTISYREQIDSYQSGGRWGNG